VPETSYSSFLSSPIPFFSAFSVHFSVFSLSSVRVFAGLGDNDSLLYPLQVFHLKLIAFPGLVPFLYFFVEPLRVGSPFQSCHCLLLCEVSPSQQTIFPPSLRCRSLACHPVCIGLGTPKVPFLFNGLFFFFLSEDDFREA